jgi:hypothetical protein
MGLRSGSKLDLDGCRRAEAVELRHVGVAERNAVEVAQHRSHRDPSLHASERRTQAAVDSQAEGQVRVWLTIEDELGGFVEDVVDPSRATVHTDAWQGYAALPRRGFHHSSETQGTGERAKELLPWVHTIFSNLKTWLRGTYHGVSKKHLDSYLQFVYRFNRRGFEQALFEHVIGAATTASPLTYDQLTAERTG